MMGPLKVVHVPRLQRLMRGVEEPYLRRPFIEKVDPRHLPQVTPWFEGIPGSQGSLGAVDMEYGASMQPRSNPAFNDTWVIGATGGASWVIPQGIDFSRTPCCTPGWVPSSGMGADLPGIGLLFVGVVVVPAVMFGIGVAEDLIGYALRGGRDPSWSIRRR